MIDVPMYQPRIPISGGGGISHIDLREPNQANQLISVLGQIFDQQRQTKMDEQASRESEARIKQMQQPDKPLIIAGGGTTWAVDPRTLQKTDLGVPTNEKQTEIINSIARVANVDIMGLSEEQQTALIDRLIEQLDQTPRTTNGSGILFGGKPKTLRKGLGGSMPDIGGQTKGIRSLKSPIGESIAEQIKTEPRRTDLIGPPETAQSKLRTATARHGQEELRKAQQVMREPTRKTVPSREVGREPKTVEEFESEVARLKQVDMKRARAYYDKWVSKW